MGEFYRKELHELLHRCDMVVVLVLSDLSHLLIHEFMLWTVSQAIKAVKKWFEK